MFTATVLAFIAAAIYALIASHQLDIMKKTLDATIAQSSAAHQAVQIAQKSLKQAQESFVRDQRPYIWLTNDLGHPGYIEARVNGVLMDQRIGWDWHYENYGKSPAYNVRFFAVVLAGDNADKMPRPVMSFVGPGVPLPHGQVDFATAFTKRRFSRETFESLEQQQGAILIYGRIRYKDADGNEYQDGFCFHTLATTAIMFCKEKNSNFMK